MYSSVVLHAFVFFRVSSRAAAWHAQKPRARARSCRTVLYHDSHSASPTEVLIEAHNAPGGRATSTTTTTTTAAAATVQRGDQVQKLLRPPPPPRQCFCTGGKAQTEDSSS